MSLIADCGMNVTLVVYYSGSQPVGGSHKGVAKDLRGSPAHGRHIFYVFLIETTGLLLHH